MTRFRTIHRWVAFGMLLVYAVAVQAQEGNLLTNPGFEQPYISLDGDSPRQVAQGWQAWNLSASDGMSFSDNLQPEYYAASDAGNRVGNANIRSGGDAQLYFTYYATHTAGLYQTVSGVTAGTEYTFSAYLYAWSTSFDDAASSAGDGGLVVQVGIDPTGGTDPESAAIIWSETGAPQYDSYVQYSVAASAEGSTLTVWTRSTVSAPVRVNAVYVDDASLSAEAAAATNTVAPTATTANTATTPPSSTPQPTSVPPTNTVAATNTSVPPTEAATSTDVLPSATLVPPTQEQATASPTSEFSPTPVSSPTPIPTVNNAEFPGRILVTVRSGDTIAELATRYNSSIDAILSANGLLADSIIFVDQQLIVPVRLPFTPPATGDVTPQVVTLTPVIVVLTATPTNTTVAATLPAPGASYTVQFGDSLYLIALRNNTSVQAIASLNGIVNPNLIYVGQRLTLPAGAAPTSPTATATTQPPASPVATAINIPQLPATATTVSEARTYRVRFGDNLYNIALRNRVTVRGLAQANNIRNLNLIYVGQLLVIP